MRDAAVWIDHDRAKILSRDGRVHEILIPMPALLLEVVNALEGAERIVILGPGAAKHRLRTYLAEQHPLLLGKVADFDSVASLSDQALRSVVRGYFDGHRHR